MICWSALSLWVPSRFSPRNASLRLRVILVSAGRVRWEAPGSDSLAVPVVPLVTGEQG